MKSELSNQLHNLAALLFDSINKDAEPPTDVTYVKYGMPRVGYQDCLEAVTALWVQAHPAEADSINREHETMVAAADSLRQILPK